MVPNSVCPCNCYAWAMLSCSTPVGTPMPIKRLQLNQTWVQTSSGPDLLEMHGPWAPSLLDVFSEGRSKLTSATLISIHSEARYLPKPVHFGDICSEEMVPYRWAYEPFGGAAYFCDKITRSRTFRCRILNLWAGFVSVAHSHRSKGTGLY